MNRIILIGNGFDLAHGLKTSYKNFIDRFWESEKEEFLNKDNWTFFTETKFSKELDGGSISSSTIRNSYVYKDDFISSYVDETSFEGTKPSGIPVHKIKENILNLFLKTIEKKLNIQNWVDIEEEYYRLLKKFAENNQLKQVEKLNLELKHIRQKLENYLSEIQKEVISTNKDLFYQIYSPLHIEDFTEQSIPILRETYRNLCSAEKQQEFDKIFDWILENDIKHCTRKDYDDYVSGINGIGLFPEKVWFLNFNYTDTEKHYQHLTNGETLNTKFHVYHISDSWGKMCASRKNIHIHGELNNLQNPIIFGYGDELDEDYKKIEKLNDNNYLENIKSIKYLETDNYRNILNFINTDNYQVFVMGHSCGNSDRTLLNTLFEHNNCVSIKVFYHKKSDGTDNYSDMIRNISRNFNNKAKMREKVVNKIYCEPLSQTIC
ncbi:hypothetical protein FACS189413_06070 [Bacteroidia bacterium]|nr:hypothetical protein FACS189413_06070 [Bacteroidia bacterium]